MPAIYIVLILFVYAILASLKAFFHSKYSRNNIKNTADVMFFWSFTFIFIGLFFLPFAIIKGQINSTIIVYALIMAACTFLFQLFYSLAFKEGPVGLTIFFLSISSVVMPIYGYFRFHESFTVCKIIAICLLVLALGFNIKKQNKKPNLKWVLYLLLTIIPNVGCSIVQAELAKTAFASYSFGFLSMEYLFASVLAVILFVIFYSIGRKQSTMFTKKFFAYSSGVAAILCGCVFLLYFAIQKGDSSLVYPLQSGLCLTMSLTFALVFYKERLTLFQWISFSLGLASVILINL